MNPLERNLTKIALQLHTGYEQFPNIYFGHQHVGGLDDLKGYMQTAQGTFKICEDNDISSELTSSSCSSQEHGEEPNSTKDLFRHAVDKDLFEVERC